MSEARRIIEAEDPKAAFKNKLPRKPRYYRFCVGNDPVTFCFSIIAVEDGQAVERANAWFNNLDDSHQPWDDQVRDPVFHIEQVQITAAHINEVNELEEIFNAEAVARIVAEYEEDARQRGGFPR